MVSRKKLLSGKKSLQILTGDERELILQYVKKQGAVQRADSFETIIPRLTSKGLFSTPTTFVIEDDKGVLDREVDDLLGIIGNNTVMLIYSKIDGRSKFFKDAEDHILEFNRPTAVHLENYVLGKLNVPKNLALIIADRCGCDLSRINNEIDKLTRIGQEVTYELITELIPPTIEDRIFDMVTLISKKERSDAWKIYEDLLELKESPIKMISLIYTKFKQVFVVQSMATQGDKVISNKTGLQFYQVKYARELMNYYSEEGLLAVLKMIQATEVMMKTGRGDIRQLMDMLLMRIMVTQ